MLKKGYKICGKDSDQKYVSAFSLGRKTTYEVGEWINRPKGCGPLAVFSDLYLTGRFLFKCGRSGFYIFECEYEESTRDILYVTDNDGVMYRYAEQKDLPVGTRFADRVRLIKEVDL